MMRYKTYSASWDEQFVFECPEHGGITPLSIEVLDSNLYSNSTSIGKLIIPDIGKDIQ